MLVVHHDAMTTLMKIDKYFKLKPPSIGDPDIYLGAKLKYTRAPNGFVVLNAESVQVCSRSVQELREISKEQL